MAELKLDFVVMNLEQLHSISTVMSRGRIEAATLGKIMLEMESHLHGDEPWPN